MSIKEYFNTAKSFVVNQARLMYKEIRDNLQYLDYFIQRRIPPELGKPAVFDKNDICVILKPESQTIRIVGSGAII